MSARCSLVVNGKSVRVSTGDTPLEAALADGMIAPAPGLNGQGSGPAPRRAQSRAHRNESVKLSLPRAAAIEAPRTLDIPTRPAAAQKRTGTVTQITALGPHTVEVVVTVTRRLVLDPGHQVVVTFEGFDPVTLSPTLRVDGSAELNELVFHLRLDRDGSGLTHAFGEAIRLDHPVKVKGPVGRGYYRPGSGRLVLVAAETGFAHIWSIAHAARYIDPAREVTLMVGARDPLDLYMRPALDWLRATGVTRIVVVSDRTRQRPPEVRPGPLTAHLPSLRSTDVVYVAGDASTVGAVEVLAASAGARCYPVLLDAGI
jgi:CDP-4-dehydro-6-deoxyglucose reductase, E3